MSNVNKKYGLILPKGKSAADFTRPSVFGNDDSDEEDKVGGGKGRSDPKQAAQKKSFIKKQVQLDIEKALNEDPNCFEYDKVYEIEQKKKAELRQKEKSADDRKPKYMSNLIKAAEVRKKEYERRVEKTVQKEREAEDGMYDDKEAFVTDAYRRKMQEMQEEEERERRKQALEDIDDVTKQADFSGFYRNLLNEQVGETKNNSEEVSDKIKKLSGDDRKDEKPLMLCKSDGKKNGDEMKRNGEEIKKEPDSDDDDRRHSRRKDDSEDDRRRKDDDGRHHRRRKDDDGDHHRRRKEYRAKADDAYISKDDNDDDNQDSRKMKNNYDRNGRKKERRHEKEEEKEDRKKKERHRENAITAGELRGENSEQQKDHSETENENRREEDKKSEGDKKKKLSKRRHSENSDDSTSRVEEVANKKTETEKEDPKHGKRTIGDSLSDARARYLARKGATHVSTVAD